MRSSVLETTGRMLVVKLSSLGDLLHALPAVHCLKQGLGVRIDWVTQNGYADLVTCFRDVDRVIRFPRSGPLRHLPAFLSELRRERYDYVVDFQGLMKSGFVARATRARQRIGPSFCREGAWLFHDVVAGKRNKDRHAVDEALDVVRFLGLPDAPAEFPMDFPPFAAEGDRPRIALAPCSRWPTKNWSPDAFIELGRLLRDRAGASLYLVGGPEDRPVCDTLAAGIPEAVNTCGETTLPELGGLLHAMDLAVTVDTGPMHLAAAAGVPVLAIFGATDPARTGPYGPRHHIVTDDDLECRPCFARTCKRSDLACLTRIEPARVADLALRMLQKD